MLQKLDHEAAENFENLIYFRDLKKVDQLNTPKMCCWLYKISER